MTAKTKAEKGVLEDILQTMIVGVAMVDMDGLITFANEAAMERLANFMKG